MNRSNMSIAQRIVRPALCGIVTASVLLASAFGPTASTTVPTAIKVDSILILKKSRLLELLSDGKVLRTYKVALGRGGLAPKEREGDSLTPEGHYIVDSRNAASGYHRALHISYPNSEDRRRAASLGVPPGGAIMIHGLPNGLGWLGTTHQLYDWTRGCIAVTDPQIDEIWSMVPVGTPVEIRP
jgi:murein L,D-transpeptidase YafK